MKSRLAMVLIAVALATLATLGVVVYIQSVKAQIKEGSQPVKVLTARSAIAAGTSIKTIRGKNLVETKRIPKQFVAEGAYSSLSQLNGQVVTATLSKGEQLTSANVSKSSQAGLSYQVPDGFVGISIPVDEIIGVSGQVKQGDHINIVATFSPGPGGADMSKMLLHNVEVLFVSSDSADTKSSVRISKSSTQGSQKKTLALALTPTDAEKLVFAQEKGTIWLVLVPPTGKTKADTGGQTMESIFK